jgi:hypothetical protein
MITSFPLIFRSSEETLRFPENKSGSAEELERVQAVAHTCQLKSMNCGILYQIQVFRIWFWTRQAQIKSRMSDVLSWFILYGWLGRIHKLRYCDVQSQATVSEWERRRCGDHLGSSLV